MGANNSTPINKENENILESVKNKKHSVVTFNKNKLRFDSPGNIIVNELFEPSEGKGCLPLPYETILHNDNSINKNVFVTSDNKYVRLYADKKCRYRANEEKYATVDKPEADLFSPNYRDKLETTNFTFVPYREYQNAYYYRISNVPLNTPRLPQFYIKDKSTGVIKNALFVQYDEVREIHDDEKDVSVCREIPTTNPTGRNNHLDWNFQPLPTDAKVDERYGREVGIDRFPDDLNTNSNATDSNGKPVKTVPVTIYTEVYRDINDNVIDKKGNIVEKNSNNNPIINDDDTDVTCANIRTNDLLVRPMSGGYKLGSNKMVNGSLPNAVDNQKIRSTPLPYTAFKNYGTRIANKSNSLYYELKPEKGLLD